jgi:DNA-binding MarR family transcriptional regulator
VKRDLAFNLHVLTGRLDRAVDRVLQAEHGVSYRRFLALTLVGVLGASTQRVLADSLGVTEPSVSRMVRALAADGLLDVQPSPAGGRARRLSLTPAGEQLLASVQHEFEERLAELVRLSGVPYDEYAQHTRRVLDTLDRFEGQGKE